MKAYPSYGLQKRITLAFHALVTLGMPGLMRFLTCTSHGVVHCTSKNQINQEQLQEKCRREVGVMLISVRTQLPDDIKVQIKGEVVRELCPKDEGVEDR